MDTLLLNNSLVVDEQGALAISHTVEPDEKPEDFNEWINYIHSEAKK
jgi:hypothetical protein